MKYEATRVEHRRIETLLPNQMVARKWLVRLDLNARLHIICTERPKTAMTDKPLATQYQTIEPCSVAGQQSVLASAPMVLLTPKELAERLNVPPSWVREKTRHRARVRDVDPLPVIRLGKYVRFRWTDIEAWLARQ